MDYTSKEAKKLLKDYYFWKVLYMDMETREQIKRYFGFEYSYPDLDNVDHTLVINSGIEKGILVAPADRDHDEVIDELIEVCGTLDVKDLVNGFLHSLSTGKNQYRTALASYLFARGIKKHKAEFMNLGLGYEGCAVCGLPLDKEGNCHIEDSLSRYTLYYPLDHNIKRMQRADYVLFDLKQFRELPKVKYTDEDVDILVKILKLADGMGKANKYTALQKLITRGKIIKASGNEIIVILGVLSVCGVLQTPEQRGYAERFTSCADMRFAGYETELFYPLFYWKGRDGVDRKALAEIFPPCVTKAFNSDKDNMSPEDVYTGNKEAKPNTSRAEEAFEDGRHIIELDGRKRHYYGLSDLDPSWHREVRYSVTHNLYKRTEVYFEGNSIKKTIYESRTLRKDGTFSTGSYVEKDIEAETEDRYLLLPKTSRGSKKPWTPSLIDTPTYVTTVLNVNFGGSIFSFNWHNSGRLPLPPFRIGPEKPVTTPIEFYTYTEEYIKNVPDDYEDVLAAFRGDS